MENEELVSLYELDIKLLKSEGFITDDMTNDEKYKMIRLNQQWLLCEESDDGIMCITKKRQWMLDQNPDNFKYGLLCKNVYFIHCGIVGMGWVSGVARWYDRMYYVKSDSFTPSSRARIHESDIYLTEEELFDALNTKYEIKDKK